MTDPFDDIQPTTDLERAVDPETGELVAARTGDIATIRAALVDNLADPTALLSLIPRVTVPAGAGTSWVIPFPQGTVMSTELDMHILAAGRARAYWGHEMGEGDPFPDCSSNDARTGTGKRWDADDEGPHDCRTCPMSQWGSSSRSDRGQACREFRLVLGICEGRLILLRVPPSSLKAWDAYAVDLALGGDSFWKLRTAIGLEVTKSAKGIQYSVIRPRDIGPIGIDDANHAKPLATLLRDIVRKGGSAALADAADEEWV